MAVTIEEMHVEVQGGSPQSGAAASNAEPKKDVDLAQALTVLQERKLRLRAD